MAKSKKDLWDRQAERVRNLVQGDWTKFMNCYCTNAFSAIHHQTETHAWVSTHDAYTVSVEKFDNGRWYVYAEEHEPRDIEQPQEGYATLKAAKEAAIEFCQFFEQCWLECEGLAE
jgi:hypothetical protein